MLTQSSIDEAKYMYPNDDDENDRLDLYHHIETLSMGGRLHLAPIGEHPQRILGTTTEAYRSFD